MRRARFAVAVLGCVLAVVARAAPFRFLSWGDSRLDGATVLALTSRQAAPLGPRFTLFGGDLESNGFSALEMSTWWGAVNGDISGISSDALGAITFPVRGNHDASNAAGWQGYFDLAAVAARIGAKNFTALASDLTYSFDYENAHFVALDVPGDFPAYVTAAQLGWLDQDLGAAEVRGLTHAFLFWHGPIVTFTSAHDVDPNDPAIHSLIDILNRHPIVSALFVGHEHLMAYVHVNASLIANVTHEFEQFTHGASGATLYSPDAATPDAYLVAHGFAIVDVVDTAFTVTWYDASFTYPAATFRFDKQAPAVSTPTFTPPAGTYDRAQSVTITSATPGATICYTLDGRVPAFDGAACSPGVTYAAPIQLQTSTLIQAMAGKAGMSNSLVAVATYQIASAPPSPRVDLGGGFVGGSVVLNGTAGLAGSRLRLTDGGYGESASAYHPTPVDVRAFTTDFTFQVSAGSSTADGFAFVVQNAGPQALGPGGGGLGYGPDRPGGTTGIQPSVALKFDLYDNAGEGTNSTGLYAGGASPTVPAVSLGGGVDLHAGRPIAAHVTYDGTTLSVTLSDPASGATSTSRFPVDVRSLVGGDTAYVGFTAGTGGLTAVQEIVGWTYSVGVTPPATPPPTIPPLPVSGFDLHAGFASVEVALNGAAGIAGTRLRLTDGGYGERASAYYAAPVDVRAFTTDFTFQLSGGSSTADGFTFTVQNTGPTAVGPAGGGLGFGPDQPGGAPGIPSSVAVKFDLYDNAGEGTNSTGVYSGGASPTVPAVPIGGGVDLHAGRVLAAHLTYDGAVLAVTLSDPATGATSTNHFSLDIPGLVGRNVAYMGFTAGTGGVTAIQEILGWTYTAAAQPGPGPIPPPTTSGFDLRGGFAPTSVTLNGAASIGGGRLRLTDGGYGESATAYYPIPVDVRTFTTEFSFQISGGLETADGLTFIVQNARPTALGPPGGGLGFGPDQPGAAPGIPSSIALKFDLYDNAGEGTNSTGVYSGGASPTAPSVPIGGGVDLHAGRVLTARVTYDGATLALRLLDPGTGATWSHDFSVDVPALVGSDAAYVGFTAGTGGLTAVQEIIGWAYSPMVQW